MGIRTIFPLGRAALCALILLGKCQALGAAAGPGRSAAPLAERHQAAGLACLDCHGEGPKKKRVPMASCLACHESYTSLARRTAKVRPNPHDNHLVDLECGKCHRGHHAFENYCQTCHAELEFTHVQ